MKSGNFAGVERKQPVHVSQPRGGDGCGLYLQPAKSIENYALVRTRIVSMSRQYFNGLGVALTNPISRGRRPRSAHPTHHDGLSPNESSQWANRVIFFSTRVVVLGIW